MLNAGYFRHPTIHGDTVVFVCEDDLWTVPASGGVARRLTVSVAEVGRPALSPDGSLIAFTGRDEGYPEIYAMPAEGGEARRLTYLGANSGVRGWSPDGRIVFASDWRAAFFMRTELHAIPPQGGLPERLPWGPAADLSFGPGGGIVLGRHTADPAWWKRYRGGRAGVLWVDPAGTGEFRKLIDLPGNLASPMWVGERIFFLSDHEGHGNLYSCRPDGSELRRHTHHEGFYARLAQTDGERIVYQLAAELWLLDPRESEARRIDVVFRSPRAQRNRKFVEAAKYLHGYAVHPCGREVAMEVRGKLFTMPLWEGAVRHHGRREGVRYRLGRWLADGRRLVAVSDEGGEEHLELFAPESTDPARRLDGLELGRVVELVASPAKDEVALANHRNEVVVVDVEAGTRRVVDRSPHGRCEGLAWSPDGAWLAYASAETRRTRSIKLCEVATGATHLLSRPEFIDGAPSFGPDGRFLYFLSLRTFDPVYDQIFFDLGFPRSVRPYLVALQSGTRSPFVPEPHGLGEKPSDEKKGAAAESPAPVHIDLDGIGDRIVAFPVPEGRYTQILGIKGKVLLLNWPIEGSLERNWFEPEPPARGSLEVYDFAEQKHEVLVPGINGFEVSGDGSTLVYRAANRLRAIKAGEKPDEKLEKDPPGRKSGWIELGRIRVSVDPAAEWRQMYGEAWRLQRDNFWTPDLSGIDWPAVYERYLPLVGKVASRLEFSDLVWEMQGELGTSHAYETGGDRRTPNEYSIGQLGADLTLDPAAGLYRLTRVLRGDPWEEKQSSPLAATGIEVHEGETLLAIGGRVLGPGVPPGELLLDQAEVMVELTVGDAQGGSPRTVTLKTLRDETPVRYREWVGSNRERVHRETEGRVGYVHVPDMSPPGYAEFHRSYLSEGEREALIVDVRYNRGGHVSQLLLEKLARRIIGWQIPRWGTPAPYPEDSPRGPLIAITNESAGSDGDIFTHGFKLMRLGPVVGKRTWGGVIGIWVRHRLADNGITTQPEFSQWFVDVGWGVENYGTDPDYDVDVAPQDYAAGRDPQLELAIELALKALAERPPRMPDFGGRPTLTPPPLPPRP